MAPSPTGTGSGELLCRRPKSGSERTQVEPGGSRRPAKPPAAAWAQALELGVSAPQTKFNLSQAARRTFCMT